MDINVLFRSEGGKLDFDDLSLFYKISEHYGGVLRVRFHPKEPILGVSTGLCDGGEYRFSLWDLSGERRLLYMSGKYHHQLRGLDFSPSGDLLAIGIRGDKARIFDISSIENPKEIASINLNLGWKTSRVRFIDEDHLLISSNDGVHLYTIEGEKNSGCKTWWNLRYRLR